MSHQVIQTDERGLVHASQVLSTYLPGIDLGLAPLTAKKALLPDSTMRALRLQYGDEHVSPILRHAGLVDWDRVTETDALDLLRQRDLASLPPRPAAPAANPLWHLDMLRARQAWNHWGGPLQIDWGNVRVGQIDTGYTKHPALGFPDAPWIDVAQGETMFAQGEDGGGPGPGKGVDAMEAQMDGHGTKVASVICGYDLAGPGAPYLGVAPRVPLIPVRIANLVLISHAQRELASALDYLVDKGAKVVNLSMGFLPRLQIGAVDRAIDRAYEAGVIFVCAAGQPLSSVVSPAHGRRTIAVAGCTSEGTWWGESAYGGAVDWTAPAKSIMRAQTERNGSTGYDPTGDGTSYAAAASTGAAALWLARHGAALDAKYPLPWQRIEAFKVVAKATAKPMPNQRPGAFGAGILDIEALLDEPLPAAGTLVMDSPA